MSQKDELKDRFNAKIKRMEARVDELRADSRKGAREESEKIAKGINDMKQATKDGWDDMTEKVAARVNGWLADA